MQHFVYPAKILRDTGDFLESVRQERDLTRTATSLLAVSFVFFGLYGMILGWSWGPLQAVSSAIKLPLLFLVTMFICLPTLHLLNLLFGSKRSVMQHVVLLLATMAITSTLLLGFAPILAFFMTTSQSYPFIKLLNVAIIGFCAATGVKFFRSGMKAISVEDDPGVNLRNKVLTTWIILYMFVGTQLAWTLRPFIGDPDRPFQWVRAVGGNFYVDVIRSIEKLLGM